MIPISDPDTTFGGTHRFVRLVAAATLAFSALSLVNGCARETSSAGRAPAPATAQSRYDQLALQTLNDIVHGNFTAATGRFDTAVRQQLPPDALAGAWKTYQEQFGRYLSHGEPQDVARGDLTVVDVPLRMERQPGELRLTFNKNGRIAGFFFLKAGTPVP